MDVGQESRAAQRKQGRARRVLPRAASLRRVGPTVENGSTEINDNYSRLISKGWQREVSRFRDEVECIRYTARGIMRQSECALRTFADHWRLSRAHRC